MKMFVTHVAWIKYTNQVTNYHYVKTYLRIQTWGMERYIEYDDFYEKCQNYLGVDFNEGVGEMKGL